MPSRTLRAPREPAGQGPVEDVVDERGLPGARDPRHADEQPKRDLDIDPLEVVLRRALDDQRRAAGPGAARGRDRDPAPAGQELAGEAALRTQDVLQRPAGHHLPAVLARARPEVHEVVRAPDGGLVMLDDEERVAQVPQPLERVEELFVIPGMQSDGRLIQDVQHPDEPRPDLGGQADPLGLAPGEAPRGPVQRQVPEPHVEEELEPLADLLDERLGHRPPLPVPPHPRQPAPARGDRVGRHRGDRAAVQEDRQALRFEARALAGGIGQHAHVLGDLLLHVVRLGVPEAPLQIRDDALERVAPDPVRRPVEERALDLAVQRPERDLEADPVEPRRLAQEPVVIHDHVHPAALPGLDGALPQRFVPVRHDEVRIDLQPRPEPVAGRAGAVGRIEGKEAGRELLEAEAARGAGVELAEHRLGPFGADDDDALPDLERRFDRLRQAALAVRVPAHPVHDHLDRVGPLLIQGDRLVQIPDHAVHPRADEALALDVAEHLGVLPLPAADDGREDGQVRPGPALQHAAHDLLRRLPADRHPTAGAVGGPGPGEEHAEIVVDLRLGRHRGARVGSRGTLLDGDGGREPLDGFHLRLLQPLEELPGIRGEALDVAPLALGVEGVEGQRGLARPREAGDHDEPVARQDQVDGLEVVLARPADHDRFAARRWGNGGCGRHALLIISASDARFNRLGTFLSSGETSPT